MRVQFQKGKQRNFLILVQNKLNCPSIKELSNRINVNYSSLKNYFNESRLISNDLFKILCLASNIRDISGIKLIEENWGKIKGGKISKKRTYDPTQN